MSDEANERGDSEGSAPVPRSSSGSSEFLGANPTLPEELRGTPRNPEEPAHSLQEGVSLFNAARFWHAHEAWERIWLIASGDEKQFLQGLIQLAAAYHHVQRGTYRGGVRLFDAALRRLGAFGPLHDGIDRAAAVSAAAVHRERIAGGVAVDPGEYPQLIFSAPP